MWTLAKRIVIPRVILERPFRPTPNVHPLHIHSAYSFLTQNGCGSRSEAFDYHRHCQPRRIQVPTRTPHRLHRFIRTTNGHRLWVLAYTSHSCVGGTGYLEVAGWSSCMAKCICRTHPPISRCEHIKGNSVAAAQRM